MFTTIMNISYYIKSAIGLIKNESSTKSLIKAKSKKLAGTFPDLTETIYSGKSGKHLIQKYHPQIKEVIKQTVDLSAANITEAQLDKYILDGMEDFQADLTATLW